jgi:hypothetical protein
LAGVGGSCIEWIVRAVPRDDYFVCRVALSAKAKLILVNRYKILYSFLIIYNQKL